MARVIWRGREMRLFSWVSRIGLSAWEYKYIISFHWVPEYLFLTFLVKTGRFHLKQAFRKVFSHLGGEVEIEKVSLLKF